MHRKSKFRILIEIGLRVVLLTIVFALMGFAVGLFCGIGAGVLYGALRHMPADMTMAYRFVAVPFGVIAAVLGFFTMIYVEIRRPRRSQEMSPAAVHRTS